MTEQEDRKVFSSEEISTHFTSSNKVRVVFEKKDGTIRTMVCTKDINTIPEEYRPADKADSDRPGRPTPAHLFSAFDLEGNGWRSFTIDKVISIEPV